MPTSIFSLTLSLTHRCNLACRHCYAGRSSNRDMSRETASSAVGLALSQLGPGGPLELGLFGGEPLLAWDLVRWLLETVPRLASERNVELSISITTNGSQLSRQRFRVLNDAGVRVAVSLDGEPETHDAQRPDHAGRGSFERVARRLRALGSQVGRLSAVMVVTPGSAGRVAQGVSAILDLGIEKIDLNLDYHAAWPASARIALRQSCLEAAGIYCERALSGRPFSLSWVDTPLSAVLLGGYPPHVRCGFGRREIAVAPSGRIYPCERLIGEDHDGRWSIGTLQDWKAPPLASTQGCAAGDYCISWCRCNNAVRTGHPDRTDDLIHHICELQMDLASHVADRLQLAPAGVTT